MTQAFEHHTGHVDLSLVPITKPISHVLIHTQKSQPSEPHFVGIAGGSCAGKTSVAQALGFISGAPVISLDGYYRSFAGETFEASEAMNWDHPDMMDTDLVVADIETLRKGGAVSVRRYDHATHTSLATTATISSSPVVIVEGLWVLYLMRIRAVLSRSVFLQACERTRLIRRLRRDPLVRGYSQSRIVKQFQEQVEPMHRKYVEPSKYHADAILDAECGVSQLVELAKEWFAPGSTDVGYNECSNA